MVSLKSLLFAQGKMGCPKAQDIRSIINAIRYVMKSNCQFMIITYVGVRATNGKRYMMNR